MSVLTTGTNRIEIVPRPTDTTYILTGSASVRVVFSAATPAGTSKDKGALGRPGR